MVSRKSYSVFIMGGWLVCLLAASGCASFTAPSSLEMSVAPWAGDGLVGRQIATPHYMLFSTLRDGPFELEVAKRMEQLHESYTATVAPSEKSAEQLHVFVLGTGADYARLVNRKFPAHSTGTTSLESTGFAEGGALVVGYSGHTDRAALLAGLAHHGWHQYVNARNTSRLPAWLEEGLACDFEALDFTRGRAKRSQGNPMRIATLRKLLREATNKPLSQVVARKELTSTEQEVSHYDERFQAQAWALVSLLRDGARWKFAGAFNHMLRDITGGTFGVHASALSLTSGGDAPHSFGEAAFRAYFDLNSADLEEVYYDHLARLSGF